ncbi:MAG: hypothetical protein JRJ31_22880, partial [Deltaproteobacteria bacterium]|nr:hypothetical protein [Deltaproteobacteria bacterium]
MGDGKVVEKTIGIVGAGPAGALLALRLTSRGESVFLYDHKAPWEKPCGGVIREDAFVEFPELREYSYSVNRCHKIYYVSGENERELVKLKAPLPTVSRMELSRFFLQNAISAGAEFVPEKVTRVYRQDDRWIIETSIGDYRVDVLVGADGASSIVRSFTVGRFPREHLSLTCGY